MAKINNIRDEYFNKGLSISEIHRSTKHDHKTIRKYIAKENFNELPPIRAQRQTKLSPYYDVIDKWLLEDKKFKRKQRHTAKRVYDRLVEEFPEFDAKYRTVATYFRIRYKEIWGSKSYIPLVHKGGEAQVDFGETEYFENGERKKGRHFVMTFPYSNAGYSLLFPGETLECFLEGMQTIFEHMGGVPHKIWFDNASSIVKKIKKDGQRDCTELFMRFKNHYNFDAVFCNPKAGNEKGNVENKVGYVRRNMFVPAPEFNDIEAYNKRLLDQCDKNMQRAHYKKKETIVDLFSKEKVLLLPLPTLKFEVCRYVSAKADSCGRIQIDNKRIYSTSPSMANSSVIVKLTALRAHMLNPDMKEIVVHKRLYGNQNESFCWLPYLSQLAKKPGALKYTPVYELLPKNLQNCLENLSNIERGKLLKTLSNLTEQHGFKSAITAMSNALERGVSDSDSLVAIFNHLNAIEMNFGPIDLPSSIPVLPSVKFSATEYDVLLKGGDTDV